MMLFARLKQTLALLLALVTVGIVAVTFAGQSTDKPSRRDDATHVITFKPEPNMKPFKAVENDEKLVPISGTVVDQDGKPLSGAKLFVNHSHVYDRVTEGPPIELLALSAADGRFRFELDPKKSDSPRGEVPAWHDALIAAVAPDYGPAWVTAKEAVRGEIVLRLTPDDLPIRGRLIDSQGRPVASAVVRVEQIASTRVGVDLDALLASGKFDPDGSTVPTFQRPSWSAPTWVGRDGSVTTDSGGRFELKGLGRDRVAMLRITRQGLETAYVAVLARDSRVAVKSTGQTSPTFSRLYGEMGLELYGTTFEHVLGAANRSSELSVSRVPTNLSPA